MLIIQIWEWHILCIFLIQNFIMEKRVIGIILTILGVIGLIYAGVSFVNGKSGMYNIKLMSVFGILGLIFFLSGIGLIRNTKDKAT